MSLENDFLLYDKDDDDDDDEERTIEYIKNYLPQDLKEKFNDNLLSYFLDLIDEYYIESGLLDVEPDEKGYINVNLEEMANYIVKESKEDEMGEYDPEEILFIVLGEMEYVKSLGDPGGYMNYPGKDT
jgi:hypothetical protein